MAIRKGQPSGTIMIAGRVIGYDDCSSDAIHVYTEVPVIAESGMKSE